MKAKKENNLNPYSEDTREGYGREHSKNSILKRNALIIGIAVAVITAIAATVMAVHFKGNQGLSENTLKSLKKDSELKQKELDKIVTLTSEEAPWFHADDKNRLYFEPDLFDGEELVVPAYFNDIQVLILNGESFSLENETATKVTVSEGIRQIGSGAFSNFSKLKEVSIPSTVTRVSADAFHGTPWLRAQKEEFVVVGDGVLIKYNGISDEISIPSSVKIIDCMAFRELDTAETIIIPPTVTYIGSKAFSECEAEEIQIPSSVSYIENDAFKDSEFLSGYENENLIVGNGCMISYEVSDGLIRVPDEAICLSGFEFGENGRYITLYIGKNVAKIADLEEIGYVEEFKVDPDNTTFSAKDGVLYNRSRTILYKYPVFKTDEKYEISELTYQIGTEAFTDCQVEYLLLPSKLNTIGDRAFMGCENLKEISLPDSVTSLGVGAFRDCKSLTDCELPDNIKIIPHGIFYGCESMSEIYIPATVTTVRGNAFRDCSNLKKLYFPERLVQVETGAFSGCDELKITVDENNPRYESADGKLIEKISKDKEKESGENTSEE